MFRLTPRLQFQFSDDPGRGRRGVGRICQVWKKDEIAKITDIVAIVTYYIHLAGVDVRNGGITIWEGVNIEPGERSEGRGHETHLGLRKSRRR